MHKKLNSVLLIDDDDGTNFINQMLMERAEIANTIVIALNGKEAIDYLTNSGKYKTEMGRQNPEPMLILLDINMPIMDGWEFLIAYRNLPINKSSKIIMFSSTYNPDDKTRADSILEITEFRNKPLTNALLSDIMKTHFAEYV